MRMASSMGAFNLASLTLGFLPFKSLRVVLMILNHLLMLDEEDDVEEEEEEEEERRIAALRSLRSMSREDDGWTAWFTHSRISVATESSKRSSRACVGEGVRSSST